MTLWRKHLASSVMQLIHKESIKFMFQSKTHHSIFASTLFAAVGFLAMASPVFAQKIAKNPIIVMSIEKKGDMTIELLPGEAPKTVAHILQLVKSKFYDGILFHRLEKSDSYGVLQGGDPGTKKIDVSKIGNKSVPEVMQEFRIGNGGSGKTVPLEATKSVHLRGTMGMARTDNPDTGDSQFFFSLMDNHQWDYKYCVFGKVTNGLKVMDSIRPWDKIKSVRMFAPKKKK